MKANIEAWYSEQQILKVWDKYICSQKLKYFFDTNTEGHSIFGEDKSSMTLRKQAGLLVNQDKTLYRNKQDRSVSIAGAVDFESKAGLLEGFNGITNDILYAFNQIKDWNLDSSKQHIHLHSIIFPYHIHDIHWGLGIITLSFSEDNILDDVKITVYNPSEDRSSNVRESVKEEIQRAIQETFETSLILHDINDEAYKKQQYDGNSCGVISAENGKDIVEGQYLRLTIIYEDPYRIEALRNQHLSEVSDDLFYEMQLRNEDFSGRLKYTKPESFNIIKAALIFGMKSISQDLSLLLSIEESSIARATKIRDIIHDNSDHFSAIDFAGRTINFVILFFKRSSEGGLEFQGDSVNIFEQISQEINAETKTSSASITVQGSSQSGSNLQSSHSNAANIDKRTIYDNLQLTADGLRKSLHGNLYQLSLLTLVAYRAYKQGKLFHLISEAKEFEKFDDLVIDYGDRITFLQAKHSSIAEASYTATDFCADSDNDASLAKYFDSWIRLKVGSFTKTVDDKEKSTTYVFFTNKGIDNGNGFLEELKIEEDEFLFTGICSKTFRFQKGKSRAQFIDAIRASSDELRKRGDDLADIEVDLEILDKEIIEAAKYIEKHSIRIQNHGNNPPNKKSKISKSRSELNYEKFPIDGRSNLSQKAKALLALALADEKYKSLILSKIKKEHAEILRQHFIQDKIEVKINNPKSVLSNLMSKEIEEFLDEFVIKIEQPNNDNLMHVIAKELEVAVNVAPKELFNSLYKFMLDWLSKRHDCILKSDSLGSFITAELGDSQRVYLLGATQIYEKEFEGYRLDWKHAKIRELSEFLSNNNEHIAVVEDDGDSGVEIRVYSTIKPYKAQLFLKDDEWGFLSSNSPYLMKLTDILRGNSIKLLLVDCRKENDIPRVFIEALQNANLNNRKILLLIRPDQKDQLKILNAQEFNVDPLNDEQLEEIYKEADIIKLSLGGKEYSISSVLKDKDSGAYKVIRNLDWFREIIEHSKDNRHNSQNLPYDVYVANDLVEGVPLYHLRHILEVAPAKLFVIENMSRANRAKLELSLRNWFNNEKKTSFASDTQSSKDIKYRLVSDLDNLERYSASEKLIYIVSANFNINTAVEIEYLHLQTRSIENFEVIVINNYDISKLPTPLKYDFDEGKEGIAREEDFFTQYPQNSIIISADAGYGKSSFCINRASIQQGSQNLNKITWVIRLSLPVIQFLSDDFQITKIFTEISIGENWPRWQFEALKHDMRVLGRVTLLLDGFDEIKSDVAVRIFNTWISQLPLETKIVITTRPYSYNKIILPKGRSLGHYLTLKEYTDIQHKKYIEEYVQAIYREFQAKESEEKELSSRDVRQLAKSIYEKMNDIIDKNIMHLLGVPLESYVFCETLKPSIMYSWLHDEQANFNEVFEGVAQLSTIMLYQYFIRTKLSLFLEKHMEMPLSTTLRFPHRVYSFTSSYNDILMVYAFRQAFDKNYGFVSQALNQIYYTTEMINELQDTGIVTISNQGTDFILKFNHDTYQDYFAALCILKGLIAVENIVFREAILEHRHMTKYRTIMLMLSHLSLSGDPLVPGWDKNNQIQVKSFWSILCAHGDILGFADLKLYKNCIQELNQLQKERLQEIIKDEDWSSRLIECITITSAMEDKSYKKQEIQRIEMPVLARGISLADDIMDSDFIEDSKTLKVRLMNKANVYKETKSFLISKKRYEEIAKLFEEIVTENKINGYWDIDGGFLAMSLLGNSFSDTLADYFVIRVSNDPSWRSVHALTALNQLFTPELNQDTQDLCAKIFCCLLGYREEIEKEKQSDTLKEISQKFSSTIIGHLGWQLEEGFSLLIIQRFDVFLEKKLFKNIIDLFNKLLWVAMHNEYAVIVDGKYSKIQFVKDEVIDILIKEEGVNGINYIVRNILEKILITLKSKVYDSERFVINMMSEVQEKDVLLPDSIEQKLLELIVDEKHFQKAFNNIKKDGSKVLELYRMLEKYALITASTANVFIQELNTDKATGKNEWWSAKGGIDTVGYMGKFFNQACVEYLILRSNHWPKSSWYSSNQEAAVGALKKIYSVLKTIPVDSKSINAILSYNECIKDRNFVGESDLQAIVFISQVYYVFVVYDNPALNLGIVDSIAKKRGADPVNGVVEISANIKQYQLPSNEDKSTGIDKSIEKIELEGYTSYEDEVPLHEQQLPTINQLTTTSFAVKEAIEALPIIQYFFKEILYLKYPLPEFMDSNYFKIAVHYTSCSVGMFSISGKFDFVTSMFPTVIYGERILTYEYLAKLKQENFQDTEDKSINSPIEFVEKCSFDIAAQIFLGIVSGGVSSATILYDTVISGTVGGMQCYSQYNQFENLQQDKNTPMEKTIISYVMDSLVLYSITRNIDFDFTTQVGQMLAVKQSLSIMSVVVMTDHMSKLLLASVQKVNLIEPLNNMIENIYGYFTGECNSIDKSFETLE